MVENIVDTDAISIVVGKLNTWWESFLSLLPNIIVAIVVIALFSVLGIVISRFIKKAMKKASSAPSVTNIISKLSMTFVIGLGVFIALGLLNLDKTIASILAGAGVIGLAIGFAFQEIASNLLSGVFIALEKPFRVGDVVKVGGHEGTICAIRIRTTIVETFDGLNVIIPNKNMFTDVVVNFTETEDRRVDIECGVSYADDLQKVKKIVLETLETVEGRNKNRDIAMFFKEFGDSSINFVAHVWIEYSRNRNYMAVKDDAILKLKQAFDREKITIPFPIRTIDFGIKGGVELKDALPSKKSI